MEKQTIRLYLVLTGLRMFGITFVSAIYVTFLLSKGLNLLEVNLVNLVFFTTLFLMEIPTGAVADVFGRKFSVVMSHFLLAIGLIVYAFSDSFWGFALAEAISAIGITFSTGAFQAWLVDKLRHDGYAGPLNPIFSREQQVTQAASIAGALIGAVLAEWNLALPWLIGGLIVLIGGVVAWICMKEEYFVPEKFSFGSGWRAMKATVRSSLDYGIRNSAVRFILIVGTLQFFSFQALNMQWQPFFSRFLEGTTALGFISAAIGVSLMIGAGLSQRFLVWMKDERKSLVAALLMVGIGVVATAVLKTFGLVLAAFLLHEVARGLFRPLKDAYLNDNIPSKERATIISFESISHHVGGMVGLLFSGAVAQNFGIPVTWFVCGGVLVVGSLFLLRNGHKV